MCCCCCCCVWGLCVWLCARCVCCVCARFSLGTTTHTPLCTPLQPTTNHHPQVSVSDFLTLFSARTHNGFFWSQRPGKLLLAGAIIALGISTALACAWPAVSPDGIPTEGMVMGAGSYKLMPLWVWIYCIVWWWIQDAVKVRCGGGRARGVRGACCARVCVFAVCVAWESI